MPDPHGPRVPQEAQKPLAEQRPLPGAAWAFETPSWWVRNAQFWRDMREETIGKSRSVKTAWICIDSLIYLFVYLNIYMYVMLHNLFQSSLDAWLRLEFSVCKLDPYPNLNVQKYMHDEAALNLMETDLYSKPRTCFFSGTQGVFCLMILRTLEALQLSYAIFYFVDDGLSRSFLTIFSPHPKSSEGNIDIKKNNPLRCFLWRRRTFCITGWIGWVFFEVFSYWEELLAYVGLLSWWCIHFLEYTPLRFLDRESPKPFKGNTVMKGIMFGLQAFMIISLHLFWLPFGLSTIFHQKLNVSPLPLHGPEVYPPNDLSTTRGPFRGWKIPFMARVEWPKTIESNMTLKMGFFWAGSMFYNTLPETTSLPWK